MKLKEESLGEALSTLTHARIRAEQGDVKGARVLLRRILEQRPHDTEAAELLEKYEGSRGTMSPEEVEERLAPARSADAGDLAASFRRALGGEVNETGYRIRMLRSYLERINRLRSK